MTLPLEGIRVIDLTTTLLGPYATQTLGDFGADVIKVETPAGDVTRDVGPSRNAHMGAIFLGSNRNKRSVALNLKQPAACDALWRLLDSADVLVHNMRSHAIDKLGFGPREVFKRAPTLVYGALHGYRDGGPYAGRPAYDDVIQGESGLAGSFTERDGMPKLVPASVVDKTVGLIASNGLLAALIKRLRTHKGVHLEVGMFEGMVGYNLVEHQYGATFDPPIEGAGYPRAMSQYRRPHRTRDGYICMLPYTDLQWQRFWAAAGQPGLADDERFATVAERSRNIDALYETAGALLAARDTADWLRRLGDAEIAVGPVNQLADLAGDPHLAETGFFRRYQHPTEGALRIPDTAYRLDREALPIRHHQPRLGEHTHEVLSEAGLCPSEIAALDTPD